MQIQDGMVSRCRCRALLGVASGLAWAWVSHHMCAIVLEKRSVAGVGVGTQQSAFVVAEHELVLGSCASVMFLGGVSGDAELRVL